MITDVSPRRLYLILVVLLSWLALLGRATPPRDTGLLILRHGTSWGRPVTRPEPG